jgi:FtsZ-interacting cell division protein YlmF
MKRRRSAAEGGAVIVRIVQFGELVEVGDAHRAGEIVDLMLDATTAETRRRAIDFVSGLAYGTGGNVEKVSEHHFRVTPARRDGWDIDGDQEPRTPKPPRDAGAATLPEPPGDSEGESTVFLPTSAVARTPR